MTSSQHLIIDPMIYDAKYSEFINNTLKETVESVEKEQKLSDKVLLNLYNIFGGVFERALELYEKGCVTHIFPSETVVTEPHSKKDNDVTY
ncbi:uncharacterized protein LOC143340955 isoform X2 [Colletes latitarsis]|uniref:uncharacterized protein LOC143340955 isoform X2 n=1 Tax=Colletes latitarsis TaxID=2605962 RepID=UPI0040368490